MVSRPKTPGIKSSKENGESPFKAPDGFWLRCDSCAAILQTSSVQANQSVCTECGHHFRIGARRRLELFCDPQSLQERDAELMPRDILEFFDSKPYAQRIQASIKKVGLNDAFVAGSAKLEGRPVEVGAFEFSFMGGSMGTIVGEKVSRVFDRAFERRCPAVVFHSSGGARMQEGLLSLMQMAKTSVALSRLKDAGIPYVSVMTDPTTGGVAASFAMLGDLHVAEPNALVGFAGPRVIEQTINQKLLPGFQRSEFLLEHGMIDAIVGRRELRSYISRVLGFLFDG
jgi:acetyl-CoA carboxylase carboxyl transferase subunit beta